ncbi:hypothetical protein V8C86DRAFT_927933 [Haematococcus lacustris]
MTMTSNSTTFQSWLPFPLPPSPFPSLSMSWQGFLAETRCCCYGCCWLAVLQRSCNCMPSRSTSTRPRRLCSTSHTCHCRMNCCGSSGLPWLHHTTWQQQQRGLEQEPHRWPGLQDQQLGLLTCQPPRWSSNRCPRCLMLLCCCSRCLMLLCCCSSSSSCCCSCCCCYYYRPCGVWLGLAHWATMTGPVLSRPCWIAKTSGPRTSGLLAPSHPLQSWWRHCKPTLPTWLMRTLASWRSLQGWT